MRILAIAGVLLVALAACGGGAQPSPGAAADVTVEMRDFQVVPTKTTLKAGELRIAVKNVGASVHELTIIKTDLAPDQLPQDQGKAKEDGLVRKAPDLNPGASTTVTVTLAAGKYAFICNQPGHYVLGMRVQVTVQ